MIQLNKNKKLKELGFRLLIQVHDEIIAECPEENAEECSKMLAEIMSKSAEALLEMPIDVDVVLMRQWSGEKLDGSKQKKKEAQTSHAMDKEIADGDK